MVNKRFIITGSSGGVGALLVKELSKSNLVDALFNTNMPNIVEGETTRAIKIDLNNELAIAEYVAALKGTKEEIVFIHAAAVSPSKLISDVDKEDLVSTFSVNVFSVFHFARYLIPLMMSSGGGSFIFLSSVAPRLQIPGTSIYATSKVALEQFSYQIVSEYSQFNVRSNVLRLGYFDTGLIKKLSPRIFTSVINRIPNKNLGDVNEIPKIIKLIVESNYVNGSIISIDGGIN